MDNLEKDFAQELITRTELIGLVKELLMMVHLVCENDFEYTKTAINNGESYGAKTLFESAMFGDCENIRTLNVIYQDLLDYLDIDISQLFNELVEFEDDDETSEIELIDDYIDGDFDF